MFDIPHIIKNIKEATEKTLILTLNDPVIDYWIKYNKIKSLTGSIKFDNWN